MVEKLVIKKIFFVGLITMLLIASFPARAIHAQDSFPNISNYYFLNSWGGEGNQLVGPSDVAVSPDGKLYIANAQFDRITIVDKNGFIYNEIGGAGQGDGEFWMPFSVAINTTGEIFVADAWNRRLQKFDSAGNHLLTFGVFGEGPGEIFAPQGLAFDANSDLLVADGNKILKYSPTGEFLMEWGSDFANPGSGDYEFNRVNDVAVGLNGKIYVADGGNYRIQIFDSAATYVGTVPIFDDFQSFIPQGVAIDAAGHLYVTANDQVFVYEANDANYSLIDTWGGSGTDLGQLGGPSGIYIDNTTGEIIVSEQGNNRVSIFDSTGSIITTIGTPVLADGYFNQPRDLTIANNKIYVSDTANNRIQVFNEDGTFITKWGEWGAADGQFDVPWGIDADSLGNILVADSNNHRIQKFDDLGNWISSTDLLPYYPAECFDAGWPVCVLRDIEVDHNDNLFIWMTNFQGTPRIIKLNSDMSYQTHWDAGGYLAVDSLGNVYTTWANYVTVYSNDGTYLRQWGEGPGPYLGFAGITIDIYDDVYVMEAWNGYISKFSNDGTLLGTYGNLGHGPGEFGYGSELEITSDGTLYITDSQNQRIQAIGPTLPEPDQNTGLILNGNLESSNTAFGGFKSNVLMKSIPRIRLEKNLAEAVPGLDHWVYGGTLAVNRSSSMIYEGNYSLQLGFENTPAFPQGIGEAWAYQVFYVPAEWTTPTLKFNYNVITNDSLKKSNFIVEIQDAVGLNNLDVIVLDGSDDGTPAPGTALGWKSIAYDLSPYRGQQIRLKFSNRNLYPESLGIWSFVEKVNVISDSPPTANPGGPYLGEVNTPILFDGRLSIDPDGSPLTYAWNFGDGNVGEGSTLEHHYAASGIYDVCLTVNDGSADSEPVCTIAVAYDPTEGFVTGGGWINSPAGAYTPDETLSGKAVFGFVSKYKKGASIPEGNTKFVFEVGDLSFQSNAYDWLLVSKESATAQYKGTGMLTDTADINGNLYKFMLWAGDGTGSVGSDTFRIRIWWEDLENIDRVIYDNGFDQEIDGGNIVVHLRK